MESQRRKVRERRPRVVLPRDELLGEERRAVRLAPGVLAVLQRVPVPVQARVPLLDELGAEGLEDDEALGRRRRLADRPAAKLHRGEDLRRPGRSDTADAGKVVERRARQPGNAAERREDAIGEIERARARPALAENDRDELVVAERMRTAPRELFTRPIVLGNAALAALIVIAALAVSKGVSSHSEGLVTLVVGGGAYWAVVAFAYFAIRERLRRIIGSPSGASVPDAG